MTRQLNGTRIIRYLLKRMLAAVDLDHQLARGTGEIHHALPDRMLAPELPGAASRAQGMPQALLRVGGAAAQAAGNHRALFQLPHLTPALSAPPGRRGGKVTPFILTMRERDG
jgi:hypothetical protein